MNILKNLKIPCILFTKNERALGNLRLKYFDHKIEFNKEKTIEDLKKRKDSLDFSQELFYKSNKLLLSKSKKYLSTYDYLADRQYQGEDLVVVNDEKFWQDQDYLRIYKKYV